MQNQLNMYMPKPIPYSKIIVRECATLVECKYATATKYGYAKPIGFEKTTKGGYATPFEYEYAITIECGYAKSTPYSKTIVRE